MVKSSGSIPPLSLGAQGSSLLETHVVAATRSHCALGDNSPPYCELLSSCGGPFLDARPYELCEFPLPTGACTPLARACDSQWTARSSHSSPSYTGRSLGTYATSIASYSLRGRLHVLSSSGCGIDLTAPRCIAFPQHTDPSLELSVGRLSPQQKLASHSPNLYGTTHPRPVPRRGADIWRPPTYAPTL